jgi:hypothetical protein
MPLTRGELKALVKDLLVEILSEGLGNVQAAAHRPLPPGRMPIQGSVREGKANNGKLRLNGNGRTRPEFDPNLDTPIHKNPALKEQIRANAGGNPIMQAILADTAATTLQKLSSDSKLGSAALEEGASSGSRPGIPQVEQINGRPEEVFGEETASRWADLAFADKKPA